MTTPDALRQALDRLGGLPAVPGIAQKILALKIIAGENEQALFDLVERDPPILARVVGLANSPLFGTHRRIVTLRDAVVLLGSKRVKMVAISFAMLSSMHRKPANRFDIHKLWQHSLAVAMTMDALSRRMPEALRPPAEDIYLAGLLHDIGFLVLDYLDPALSDRFHARLAASPEHTVEEIEADMLALDHRELGAELGRHWNLPPAVVAVLRHHHTPEDPRAADGRPLVDMAGLAEKLLPALGISEPVRAETTAEDWRRLGIDPAAESEIRADMQRIIAEVAALPG